MNLKHQPLWLLAGIAVCITAQASPQQTQAAPAPTAVENSDAAMKVAIDPKTGKLRAPTDDEARALSQAAQPAANARSLRRAEPLGAGKRGFVAPATAGEATAAQRKLASGGTMQQVPESFMTNVAIQRDAQGRMVLQHVDGETLPQAAKEGDHE
ncbi:post-PEP-CTERM-1 domain-containing protein [Pseudoxanthomonas indica]|uniref:Uncharacterized protein n=1 Tax=Pseudoxanthomonas indica TaxID=428993 RepID=A0A1T5KHM5_9GAMM|nr:hypothetical protein [Pseudoxanthomonas indica]SKC63276.1 hypothetical protein SAMN06296058_1723 [Pseudoxanthomonas indica]